MLQFGSDLDKVVQVHGGKVGATELSSVQFLQSLVVRSSVQLVISGHVLLHEVEALVVHAVASRHIEVL